MHSNSNGSQRTSYGLWLLWQTSTPKIFTLQLVTVVKSHLGSCNKNNFMFRGIIETWGTVSKGHSISKVENLFLGSGTCWMRYVTGSGLSLRFYSWPHFLFSLSACCMGLNVISLIPDCQFCLMLLLLWLPCHGTLCLLVRVRLLFVRVFVTITEQ